MCWYGVVGGGNGVIVVDGSDVRGKVCFVIVICVGGGVNVFCFGMYVLLKGLFVVGFVVGRVFLGGVF